MQLRALAAAGSAFGVLVLAGPAFFVSDAPAAGVCDPNAKPAKLDYVLKDMHGKDVSLASYKGQVVLLNFWATWCDPCKEEIPVFVKMQTEFKNRGFTALGFSVDDTPEQLKAFAAHMNMNYPILVGDGHEDLQNAYGPIWAIPVTVLISRDGKMCKKHSGFPGEDALRQEITALVKQEGV